MNSTVKTQYYNNSERNTTSPAPEEAQTTDDTSVLVFQIFSYIIDVMILLGNSFVIWLAIHKKSLHTVTNILLVSLAFSDLFVGLAVIPSFMACVHVTCDLVLAKMVYDYFLFVSVANLCAITVDRYTAVMHPLRYATKMTAPTTLRIIAVAWVIPAVLSILPVTWTYTDTSEENQVIANKVFYTIQVLFFVLTPCCLMLWAYSTIFNEAMKQARRIHAQTGYASNNVNGGRALSPNDARNAIKVFATVVAIFVLCWSLSAYRTILIYYHLGEVHSYITMASRILLIFNSAINPVFYTLWKKDVRREVERLLVGRRRNAINPAIRLCLFQQAATIGN